MLLQGAHTAGFNNVGYGVCLMGNFMDHEPTKAALQVLFIIIFCVAPVALLLRCWDFYRICSYGNHV